MTRPISDIEDPRLVKALAHPLRIRIIGILEQRSATPKEMARMLGVPLENLSYHVRTLRDFGYIELEETRMVRGAVEHRYSLAVQPRITAETWEQLPAVVREALDAAHLSQIWETVSRAATQGKLDRPESHLTRRFARLDEPGFAAASQVLTEAWERLVAIEQQAAERLDRHETAEVPAFFVTMLFDAPDPVDGASDAARAPGHRTRAKARRAATDPAA
ncbi:MAG TPA: winged helix-turn-helix domain-containing protein [Baekduia sp.]|nr:winged helix-turn-helix domain-containing protein [Baekduia sp.]